jgi:tetratricopeptide (TPR) repeat protein
MRERLEAWLDENPDKLFYAQTLLAHHEEEAEAVYRRALVMAPNSIRVIYGLGTLITTTKPKEAIGLLEKVIQMEPQSPYAYLDVAVSYRTLGQYDEAIAWAEKAYQINPQVFASGSMDNFLRSVEWLRNKSATQLQVSEPDPDESTSVASSKKTDTPQVADVQEESVKKTASDSEPSESRGDTRKAEARQAMEAGMEAEFEQMLADYERMIVGDLDPSAIVERQIADLERSVEPKLNQSEDYIKLGEAYEEAGEREKAEEVYRRARERFPDDERVRRKAEASEKRRKRSTDAEPSEEED